MDKYALEMAVPLPTQIDLRPICPPVYSQGNFNACTANAVGALLHVCRLKKGLSVDAPSRMYIYWFERILTNQQGIDSGGSITDAVSAVINHGYCLESLWPYTPDDLLVEPNASAIADATNHRAISPVSLASLQQIKASLASQTPVAFGLRLYNSFFDADGNGGYVPMPDQTGACEGHAAVLVGYDDVTGHVIMRSSWGTQTDDGTPCGDQGYYFLPYAYIDGSLSSDYWSIDSVTG